MTRMTRTARSSSLAVVLAVAACTPAAPPAPTASPTVAPSGSPTSTPTEPPAAASPSAIADHSDVPGRLLVQHLGNALDGSEADETDGNYGRRRLYVMDPDGANITELLPSEPVAGKNHADVSADFARVVFQDWSDTPKIHAVDLDGSNFRTLTDCDCIEGDPAWSPTGDRVVFNRAVGDVVTLGIRHLPSGDVTLFEATAGTLPPGVTGEAPEHPSWSPDGSLIVFAMLRRDGSGTVISSRIMTLDVATGAVTELPIPHDLRAGEPRYSPDGALLLFASDSAETSLGKAYGNVFTSRADGTDVRNLTGKRGREGGTGASWTADGRYILYMYDRIRLMRPDGSGDALWHVDGPDMSEHQTGFGYTTYWLPPAS